MTEEEGMLESWNDGVAKAAILEFIESVTTSGDSYVPTEERIATFDNDGTLWCEKPRYVQVEFLIRSRDQGEADNAASRETESFPPVERGRVAELIDRVPNLISGVADAARGITTEAFEVLVREFFDTATHPTLGVPFTQLAYRPMLELIELLKANDFRVYICTGGGRDFVRVVSEEVYGISRERVIGSAGSLEYRDGDIYRKKGLELPIADGPGKPVHIWKRTGRKPLFACGNADGDMEMLQIARFPLLIHHDDDEREFAYDEKAEGVLGEATARGWTIVSMKEDFRRVF
jgi:phosphoserine phosphatase